MPIQTYEANAVREGYTAHKGTHVGRVLRVPTPETPGTVTLAVDCTPCGQVEVWAGIPVHSAMHAEPQERTGR